MRHTYYPGDEPLLGPDGTPRYEGLKDDDGIYHFPVGVRVDGGYAADRDDDGWFVCLCNKPHPGPLVFIKAPTCLACIAINSEP
jgi:hypothetical protein